MRHVPADRVGATNPTTVVFLTAILPASTRRRPHVTEQVPPLGLVFSAIGVVSDSALAAAGTFRAWFARSPRRLELAGGAGGRAMVAIRASVALTGRKD